MSRRGKACARMDVLEGNVEHVEGGILEDVEMENSTLAEACRKTGYNRAERQRRRRERAVSHGYR